MNGCAGPLCVGAPCAAAAPVTKKRLRDRVVLAVSLILLVGVMGLVAHRYYSTSQLAHAQADLARDQAQLEYQHGQERRYRELLERNFVSPEAYAQVAANLRALLDDNIRHGCGGFWMAGSTGEGPLLDDEQRAAAQALDGPVAILAGDGETGVTIMQMEAGLDTGPVRLEGRTPIDGKTTGDLTAELAAMGARLVVKVLADIAVLDKAAFAKFVETAKANLAEDGGEDDEVDGHWPRIGCTRDRPSPNVRGPEKGLGFSWLYSGGAIVRELAQFRSNLPAPG